MEKYLQLIDLLINKYYEFELDLIREQDKNFHPPEADKFFIMSKIMLLVEMYHYNKKIKPNLLTMLEEVEIPEKSLLEMVLKEGFNYDNCKTIIDKKRHIYHTIDLEQNVFDMLKLLSRKDVTMEMIEEFIKDKLLIITFSENNHRVKSYYFCIIENLARYGIKLHFKQQLDSLKINICEEILSPRKISKALVRRINLSEEIHHHFKKKIHFNYYIYQ